MNFIKIPSGAYSYSASQPPNFRSPYGSVQTLLQKGKGSATRDYPNAVQCDLSFFFLYEVA